MLKLVFKTPKLPCPAFSLQGLGWIPHKKKPASGSRTFFHRPFPRRYHVLLYVRNTPTDDVTLTTLLELMEAAKAML